MSSVDSIRAKIEELNKQSAYLNSQRSQNIGKRDALSQQCDELLASYEREYSIKLTPDNLDAEIERVLADKQVEINTLGSAITAITQGNYSEAYTVLGLTPENAGGTTTETVTESTQPAEPMGVQEQVVSEPTNIATPEVEEPVNITTPSIPEPTVATPEVTNPSIPEPTVATPEVTRPIVTPEVDPIAPPTPVPMMEGFSKPLTPPPVSVPPTPSSAPAKTEEKSKSTLNSFEAIFGGTQFTNN